MCVLALAWDSHPDWRLVLAGNRDELHTRPAAPLHRWDEPKGLIAGQDLLSGGTWLGVSEQGRLAVVTNFRSFDPPDTTRPSRGLLMRDLLAGEGQYAEPDTRDLSDFNPFNLITLLDGRLAFWSNRPAPVRRELEPSVYGLSNGTLDAPWPKTVRLKAIVADWLIHDDAPEALLAGLAEDHLPPTAKPSPPSDAPMDAASSPIFIRNPVYGTRCSTVVAIDRKGRGHIVERRFDAEGRPTGETALTFVWPG